MKTRPYGVLIALAAVAGCSGDMEQKGSEPSAAAPYTTWETYGGGAHSSQYSALADINRDTVAELELAWSFPAGDRSFVFNPIVVDDVMYVLARDNEIVALDAATGRELWAVAPETGVAARGIHYWESADGTDRRLVFQGGGLIQQLDAATGEAIASVAPIDTRAALDGREAPRRLGNDNPGRVFEDLMIVSLPASGAGYDSTPGNVGAWNLLTGELEWVFHAIPHPGELGYETWPGDAYLSHGGVHNWSEFTIDEANGIAFLSFGTARYDFFGGDREGDNLFANSLVAIDARTGGYLWHQQLVHHDLWDYDLPQAAKLLTLHVQDSQFPEGGEIEAVAQATKQGFLFVFDRHTGEPVWPIEERPVPQSDLPGEFSSPTQPFPVVIEPFTVQSFTADDINPFLSAEDQARLREVLAGSRNDGLFTPPSFEGSIGMPGHNGGANWASSAVDPINGEFYVISKNLPVMLRATLTTEEPTAMTGGGAGPPPAEVVAAMRAEAEAMIAAGADVRYNVPYEFMRIGGLSAIKPPWSQITAYDLNTGEKKWQIPNGSTPGPGFPADSGAHFPRGAPLVTAGGLLFVATAQDRMLRAYDRDTAEVLWAYELPNGSEGIPAMYEVDGKQYLAVNVTAGTGLFPAPSVPPPPGDGAYMVFSLP